MLINIYISTSTDKKKKTSSTSTLVHEMTS